MSEFAPLLRIAYPPGYTGPTSCERGHKVCTLCHGCVCEGPRVSTDKHGRTLCAACREANR
jgi:hypothetical protein